MNTETSTETIVQPVKQKVKADTKVRHPTDEKFLTMLQQVGLKDPEHFRYSDGKVRIKRAGMEMLIADDENGKA